MGADTFKSILGQYKITLLSAIVLCFCNAGFILEGFLPQWFESFCAFMTYDRAMILKGEVWRLFTCHLVHWSREHFFLDAMVFIALGIAFEQKIGRRYLKVLGASAGTIGVMLLLFCPDLVAYRGISGLINTQMVLGAGLFVLDRALKTTARIFYLGIFSVHVFKVLHETLHHGSLFATDALGDMGLFTPLAHFGGALVGLGVLLRLRGDFRFMHGNAIAPFRLTRR